MTRETRQLNATVTFYYEPREKATHSEPEVPEEYFLANVDIAGVNVLDYFTDSGYDEFSEVLYKYLKRNSDDFS